MPQATNPSFSPPVEPVLNMGNIQGLAVPGLLKPHQTLIGIQIPPSFEANCKKLLVDLAGEVASADEVLTDRREFRRRRARQNKPRSGAIPAARLCSGAAGELARARRGSRVVLGTGLRAAHLQGTGDFPGIPMTLSTCSIGLTANTRDAGMARASELEEFFPKLTRRQPRINLYAAPYRERQLICAEIAGAIPRHFRHLMNPKRMRN